jgi:dipeptidase E
VSAPRANLWSETATQRRIRSASFEAGGFGVWSVGLHGGDEVTAPGSTGGRPALDQRHENRARSGLGPYLPAMSRPRQIVAFGGGGFSMEAGNRLLDDYVLQITGAERPKVCFLPSASGDADHYIVRFYRAFAANRCEPSHVSLFRRDCGGVGGDVRAHLLAQDLIYVGGGSVVSLLGVWRAHGLDVVLREAWEAGVALCGLSAGSLCWFAEGLTAFHADSRPIAGLGLLSCSNAVHYDQEKGRREAYHEAIGAGMPGGFAAGDGAALHFVGDGLQRAVGSRPDAKAYRVEKVGREVVEVPLEVDYLGAVTPADILAA